MDQRYKIEPSFVQSVDVRGCLIIPGAPAFDPVAISSPLGCQNTTVDLDVVQTQGKWTVLNVANVGGEWTWIFSIDAHDMWIVSADGEYIRPKKVQALPVSIGQRYMVVIPTDKAQGGDYFIRANCQGFAQVIAGVALLRYGTVDDDDGDSSSSSSMSVSDQQQTTFNGDMLGDPWLDLSQAAVRYNSTLINGAYQFDPLVDAAPYPAQTMPAKPDVTMIFHANQTETTTFQIGSKAMADVHDLDMPVLYSRPGHSAQGDPSWLYRIPDGAVVDVIIQNAPNALFSGPAEPPHPIHLHGHKYWVLGSQEYFTWTYESVDAAVKDGKVSLNLDNPSSRDTFLLPTAGWFVFRFIADNPGAWLMHCHSESQFSLLLPHLSLIPLLILPICSQLFVAPSHPHSLGTSPLGHGHRLSGRGRPHAKATSLLQYTADDDTSRCCATVLAHARQQSPWRRLLMCCFGGRGNMDIWSLFIVLFLLLMKREGSSEEGVHSHEKAQLGKHWSFSDFLTPREERS